MAVRKQRNKEANRVAFRPPLAGVLAAMLAVTATHAANPVTYRVIFEPTGDAALDTLLRQSSSLERLRGKLKVGPFALLSRAEADRKTFITVLESKGYDSGAVSITIDGRKVTDPSLAEHLRGAPAASPAIVTVRVIEGPLYHIGAIETPGLTEPEAATALGIHPGDPAEAGPILAASATLMARLKNDGYAFASVAAPIAYADPTGHTLALHYPVTMGSRVLIGRIGFTGLRDMQAPFLARHIKLRRGQRYSETALASARDALLGLGVFSSVTPRLAKAADPPGEVPVNFAVSEEKRYAVSLGVTYESDLGIASDVSWMDRNVFGEAQRLTLSLGVTGIGEPGRTRTATFGQHTYTIEPGYDAKATYQVPDFRSVGQSLTATVEARKEYLPAYSRTGLLANMSIARPIAPHLTGHYGLGFIAERVQQEGVERTYDLAQIPLALTYDTTNSLLDPTSGIRAALAVTPTLPLGGSSGLFVSTEVTASTYLDLEGGGRGVLALRGALGRVFGASQFQLPPDQRFYAGGTGTVRGFTYQTVGPLFADGIPEGGTAIDAVEAEFRQRIGKSFGIAPFIDAGQVSGNGTPFAGTLRVGVGLGVLYYSGIGPIRVDVGTPINRAPGSASIAVYIGLGQAF